MAKIHVYPVFHKSKVVQTAPFFSSGRMSLQRQVSDDKDHRFDFALFGEIVAVIIWRGFFQNFGIFKPGSAAKCAYMSPILHFTDQKEKLRQYCDVLKMQKISFFFYFNCNYWKLCDRKLGGRKLLIEKIWKIGCIWCASNVLKLYSAILETQAKTALRLGFCNCFWYKKFSFFINWQLSIILEIEVNFSSLDAALSLSFLVSEIIYR